MSSTPTPPPVIAATVRVLRVRTSDGVAMSFAPLTHRSMVLVELHTADGLTGYGESWVNYPSWAVDERVATLRDGVLPALFAVHAGTVGEVHEQLTTRLDPLGRQWGAPGPVRQAISAVDTALWDLAGRSTGRSVAELAGGRVRATAPVYASSLGPDDVAAQAAGCRAAGHRAVKLKLGFGTERDERNLADARAALGDGVALYADANQAWTVDQAVAMAPALRAADVEWLEEPVRGDRLADLEELRRRTGLTLATGENVYGLDAFRALAGSPAIAVLQPDVTKAGGLTEALAVCALAETAGKRVLPHLYGGALGYAATLQLAAHAAPVGAVEYDIRDNPLRDPLLTDPPAPDGGEVALPSGPGLGVTLVTDAVAAYTESTHVVRRERELS